MLPFTERKQSIVQCHDKIRQFKYHQSGLGSSSSSSSTGAVTQGSKVCLRSSPVYSAGGKAIHMKGAQLQCGVLQNSVISPTLSDKCSFRIISGAMPPAPPPTSPLPPLPRQAAAAVDAGAGGVAESEAEEMDHSASDLDAVHIGNDENDRFMRTATHVQHLCNICNAPATHATRVAAYTCNSIKSCNLPLSN